MVSLNLGSVGPEELKIQGVDDIYFIRKCHVRAMQFNWLGRKAREIQSVRKVFCHKADLVYACGFFCTSAGSFLFVIASTRCSYI